MLTHSNISRTARSDISPFISKLSHVFLPKTVYELEEYGLPRMISKKLHKSGLINLEDDDISLDQTLNQLKQLSNKYTESELYTKLHPFERYILKYFFDGLRINK